MGADEDLARAVVSRACSTRPGRGPSRGASPVGSRTSVWSRLTEATRSELCSAGEVHGSVRRYVFPGFVGAVVLVVLAGAAARSARPTRRVSVTPKDGPVEDALPVGYWVWSAIESPAGGLTIAPGDLVPRVGPDGYEGCPESYVCTRHGIRSLAIGPRGGFHYVANVFTSSDFQHHGSISVDQVRIDERWSCAHPDWRSQPREARQVHYELRDGALRFAIDPSVRGGGWPFAPVPTGTWWIFRQVPRSAYYANVLLRLCQPSPGHACAPGCFSERLVGG